MSILYISIIINILFLIFFIITFFKYRSFVKKFYKLKDLFLDFIIRFEIQIKLTEDYKQKYNEYKDKHSGLLDIFNSINGQGIIKDFEKIGNIISNHYGRIRNKDGKLRLNLQIIEIFEMYGLIKIKNKNGKKHSFHYTKEGKKLKRKLKNIW